MEAAGGPGGEMADEGREAPSTPSPAWTRGDASGMGTDADGDLDLAWILLCYKKGARNSWGAACRWDFWNFKATSGDGLVERSSAHGRWMRGNIGGQACPAGAGALAGRGPQPQPGPLRRHGRQHRRPDRGGTTRAFLGSYVGGNRPALN